MHHESIGKLRYFVTLLDFFSGFSLVNFLDCKRQVDDTVLGRVQKLKTLFNDKTRKVTCISSNDVK